MQELLVSAAVACAVCYLAMRYLPKAVLHAAGKIAIDVAGKLGWRGIVSRLEKSLESATCITACGSCGGCGRGKDAQLQGRNGTTVEALRRTAKQ